MIDRDEITKLIAEGVISNDIVIANWRMQKAQALALVRIGDLLEKLVDIAEVTNKIEFMTELYKPLIDISP